MYLEDRTNVMVERVEFLLLIQNVWVSHFGPESGSLD
jgi:hypothetical protein